MPKQVKIGAVIWTLEENEDDLEDDNNWGDTNSRRFRIRIHRDLPPSKKRETLLHELIHACDRSTLSLDDGLKEAQVKVISHSLMALFVDHPAILEFLGCDD